MIHGCYARSGGTLRIIDDSVTNCKQAETAIAWNVQGPPGPASLPQAFSATGGSQALSGSSVTLASLSLPAGSYFVIGKMFSVTDSTEEEGGVDCQLVASGGGGVLDMSQASTGGPGGPGVGPIQGQTLVVQSMVTLAAAATVDLVCGGSSGTASINSVLTALRVTPAS